MRAKKLKPPFDSISDDAKAVGAAWFSMMHPGTTSGLIFHMEKSRPSPRAQAALDELVAKGMITREPYNRFGSIVYKPCFTFESLFPWAWARRNKPEISFRLTEKIDQAA